jgi:hypothetical protein
MRLSGAECDKRETAGWQGQIEPSKYGILVEPHENGTGRGKKDRASSAGSDVSLVRSLLRKYTYRGHANKSDAQYQVIFYRWRR